MQIKKLAYSFILENRINDLNFNLELLFEIAKINNWDLCDYTINKSLISSLHLEKNLNLDAFTLNKNNKIMIFYNDKIENNNIIFAILHEFAHLLLNHAPHNEIIDPKLLIRQENEANLFACEVLAPSCILKKLSIYTLEDLQLISNLPVKQAVDYLPLIKKDLILDEYSEKVLKNFNSYFLNSSNIYNKEETNTKNKKINYFMLSIPFIAILLASSFYLIKPKVNNNDNHTNINTNADTNINTNNTHTEHSHFFITETGKKYHLEDCRYIKNKNNIIKVNSSDEILKNYQPCSICIK